MADYCNTCDADVGGLVGLCEPGWRTRAVCECCGPTSVDSAGNCMSVICKCVEGRCVHGGPDGHKGRKFCECGKEAPHWPSECPMRQGVCPDCGHDDIDEDECPPLCTATRIHKGVSIRDISTGKPHHYGELPDMCGCKNEFHRTGIQ